MTVRRVSVAGCRYRLPMDAWERYWSQVGNEDYLAAKQLLDLSPRVANHFAAYAHARTDDGGWEVQWGKAIAALDTSGMSTTEMNLADLVAGLVCPVDGASEHLISVKSLAWMGSWTDDVLRILLAWATDGRLSLSGKLLADDPWVKALNELE